MSDLIDRQAAIDAVVEYATWLWEKFHETCNVAGVADVIRNVPSAQPKPDKNPHPEQPDSDRLGVKTGETCSDTISRAAFRSRIESEYRKWGEEYDAYQVLSDLDDFPSAQPEETCDTCKYGYFGDGMCDYCRVGCPSNYERRTDE